MRPRIYFKTGSRIRVDKGALLNKQSVAQHIKFTIEDRVARITLARLPLNILNIAMMQEIGQALDDLVGERELVAIVFDAAPDARAFTAGVAVEEHVEETIYQM